MWQRLVLVHQRDSSLFIVVWVILWSIGVAPVVTAHVTVPVVIDTVLTRLEDVLMRRIDKIRHS